MFDLKAAIAEHEAKEKISRQLAHQFDEASLTSEAETANSIARKLIAARIWQPVARQKLYKQQTCKCCNETNFSFVGDFIRQKHQTLADASRRVRIDNINADAYKILPLESETWVESVDFCRSCFIEKEGV